MPDHIQLWLLGAAFGAWLGAGLVLLARLDAARLRRRAGAGRGRV